MTLRRRIIRSEDRARFKEKDKALQKQESLIIGMRNKRKDFICDQQKRLKNEIQKEITDYAIKVDIYEGNRDIERDKSFDY